MNPFAPAGAPDTQITIVAENRGFNDVRLFAVSSAGVRSVGVVEGNTQRRLTLAWRQMELLTFRIEVLAGRTFTTSPLSASPGDRVEVIIPSNPAYTQVRLR